MLRPGRHVISQAQAAEESSARQASVGIIARTDTPVPPTNTSLEQARAEVSAARDRLRYALAGTGLGVWDWDLIAGEVWYSPSCHEMLGYVTEDTDGVTNFWRHLVHPDDLEHALADQEDMISGRTKEYQSQYRARRKDGSWAWIEANGHVVKRAADGTALRAVGTGRDVTLRVQAAQDKAFLDELRTGSQRLSEADAIIRFSARRLSEYLDASRVALFEYDAERDTMIVNSEWTLPGVPSVLGEWTRATFGEPLIEAASRGEVVVIEDTATHPSTCETGLYEILRRCGSASFISVPLVIDGQIEAALVIVQSTARNWLPREVQLVERVAGRLWDAVLRTRAEDRRKSSDNLLRMALRLAKVGAIDRTIANGVQRASEGFFDLIGYPDATGGTYLDYLAIVHPEDREVLTAKLEKARDPAGDQTCYDEHRIITENNEIRHIAYMAQLRLAPESGGRAVEYGAVVVQDITEKRAREIEAERARLQMMKHLRLSAMGTMASTLAHELNQPLSVAANYLSVVDTMLETSTDASAPQWRDLIDRALAKVLETGDTIRQIRSFTAHGEVSRSPQRLRALVFKALSNLLDPISADCIAIVNTVPDDLIVDVDALQIEHVILNLVRNAVDALQDRSDGRIRITAAPRDDAIELRVSDNGPGIAPDLVADIFSPFLTTKETGLGLGLPLCRTMVEANGGRITLETHGPEGATFVVRLPNGSPKE